jgi:hypothetical protein
LGLSPICILCARILMLLQGVPQHTQSRGAWPKIGNAAPRATHQSQASHARSYFLQSISNCRHTNASDQLQSVEPASLHDWQGVFWEVSLSIEGWNSLLRQMRECEFERPPAPKLATSEAGGRRPRTSCHRLGGRSGRMR